MGRDQAGGTLVGRAPYRLGHGFLLSDGAAEGGSRGGYWTNARKAFELAAIGRFRPGPHTLETVYLDKDELEERDTAVHKVYSHQNEDIVRLTPEELKRKMAEKEAARR